MELRRITVHIAMEDCTALSADRIASAIVEHLVENYDAEVCFTSERQEKHVEYPDIDYTNNDTSVDDWQARAGTELRHDQWTP